MKYLFITGLKLIRSYNSDNQNVFIVFNEWYITGWKTENHMTLF